MPALKLTKDLFHKEMLADEFLDILTEKSKNDRLSEDLLQILNCENAKEQIEVLKKITKEIAKLVQGGSCSDDAELPLQFLVHIFFISTSKNPCRRVLISHFQGLPENVRKKVIGPAIKEGLQSVCNQPITATVSQHESSSAQWLRNSVDTMSALIENFPFGELCVQELCLALLKFLVNVQDYFFHSFGEWLSPVQQNEVMHHCLETVKLTNRICQKSSVAMETKLKETTSSETFQEIVSKFVSLDIQILKTADFLLDCKTTSAMNIWLLLRFSADKECIIHMASRAMFSHFDWLVKSCDRTKVPDWSENLSLTQLSRRSLTVSAYLCSCYGFLAMVAMETLLLSMDGKCLLLDVLLQEFLVLSRSCSDVGSKLLAAKSVCFLTQKLREYLSQQRMIHVAAEVQARFQGDSADMKTILDFVWTSWEDSVDAIRFTVKDIFENVVTVHLQSMAGSDVSKDVKDDPLLHQLAKSILDDVSWSCKGKYPTLSVLVGHLGSARMLVLHPGIATEILQQMQEQTLACYACDLYEKLLRTHSDELGTNTPEKNAWFRQWLDPILTILCGSNVIRKKHVIEYVLPKLLKTGSQTLQYIIQNLCAQSSDKPKVEEPKGQTIAGDKLGALIICLRRARALGLLKGQSVSKSGNSELWCGVVDVNLLRQALICKDNQTRLDAFALLCENQKTSEIISNTEIQMIRYFIPQNLNNQDPAFRQLFVSQLKKFLSRMRESHSAVKRKLVKDKDLADHLNHYQDFLCWLTRLLFNNLYPGAVFARRATCLSVLVLLLDIFGVGKNNTVSDYDFFTFVGEYDLNALIFCLTDTFEDNKVAAASLLIACAKNKYPVLTEAVSKELLDISISLSQSTRPQDSTTAAYLFSVLTHQPSLHRILTQYIGNEVCTTQNVSKSAKNYHKEIQEKEMCNEINKEKPKENHKGAENENKRDRQRHENFKVNDSDTQMLENKISLGAGDHNDLASWYTTVDNELTKRYMLLMILMKSLESQADLAKTSLIAAAANRPIYPTIQCMRYCFTDIEFRKIPMDTIKHWKALVAKVMVLCFEISGVVSPVVCNSSPEGNMPIDTLTGVENVQLRDVENLDRSTETVMLMPEYLIVCCWRSVKEISLLLAQLTSSLPDVGMESCETIMTFDQVLQVGDFFTTLLLESKHRGAFELAYAGFVKVTEMLWRSSVSDLHQLPRKWLSEVMVDIRSGNPESRLCATRRSAGVPFYIQALVTTEPSSTGRQCFKQTVQELLTLAVDETVVTQEKCTAKVHALNVLRALYKDSRLKDDVASYVADGLKAAILGFKSPLWAVRNSATLLMTAMMTRIFGVKRSKDETTFSRKNCQTGRTFFYNYPSLYQFLLDQVAMATENITNELHPGLFPILMVLGRLFPSAMEGTDTSLNLAAFIPYIVKCSANPVLKTRVMAAKALQPLVEKDHVTLVFQELLTLLPRQAEDVLKQNHIHGILLQVFQLCKTIPFLPGVVKSKLQAMLEQMWMEKMDILISRHNRCLTTRTVALEVTCSFLEHFHNSELLHALHKVVEGEIQTLDAVYDPSTPSLSEFQTTICRIYCEFFLSNTDVLPFSCDSGVRLDHSDDDVRLDLSGSSVRRGVNVSDADKSDEAIATGWKREELGQNCEPAVYDPDNQADILISKCLNSKSYEVREVVLAKFTELLSSTEETHLNADIEPVKEGTYELSSAGDVQLNCSLAAMLVPHLLDHIDSEDVGECKVQVIKLLTTKSLQSAMFDTDVNRTLQIVHKMLETLNTHQCSDHVTASMIEFTGVTLRNLHKLKNYPMHTKSLLSRNNVTSRIEDLVTMTTMETDFIKTVKGYTGQMETSSEVLLACAQALVQSGDIFLGPKSRVRTSDFAVYELAFRCVLDLLQADDLEVRDTVVLLINDLSQESAKELTHPYVAMTEFLEHQLLCDRVAGKQHQLMKTLFQMVVEERREDEGVEERLFDRGEMNTYWDEIDFLQKLDFAISTETRAEIQGQKHLFKTLPAEAGTEASKQIFDCTITKSLDLKEIARNFFCSGELRGDQAYLLSFKDLFIHTNTSHHEKVVSIYKTLIMCKYGKLMCSESDCHFSKLVQQTIDTLRNCSRRHMWLPIVCDLPTDSSSWL